MNLRHKADCGELDETAWVSFDEALKLPLPMVTRTMITEAVKRMGDPRGPKLFMRYGAGTMRRTYL